MASVRRALGRSRYHLASGYGLNELCGLNRSLRGSIAVLFAETFGTSPREFSPLRPYAGVWSQLYAIDPPLTFDDLFWPEP